MQTLLRDLRFGLRMLRSSPGFTAVAVLTLALAIGANTAIFTLVNATLLRSLPVHNPQQLAILTDPSEVGQSYGLNDGVRGELAYSEYLALRDQSTVFDGLLAVQGSAARTQGAWQSHGTEPLRIKLASGNYFDVLGVPAYRGRTFAANEGREIGADPVAVMNYGYWKQRFNLDPGVVGSSFSLHGHAFTVIGVTPPGFFGENVGDAPDLWIPITMQPQAEPGRDLLHDAPGVSRDMWLQALGRMKPGGTLAQAEAAVNLVFKRVAQRQAEAAQDDDSRKSILSQSLHVTGAARGTSAVRGQFSGPLFALFGLVGLVLLIAAVNLASLQLARAATRQKEMGVRLALGAGRWQLVRQLLTECLILSILGGIAGALIAQWGVRLLLAMVSDPDRALTLDVRPDWHVLGFVAAVSLLTGVLFGLAPALRMARLDLNSTLQSQGRGGSTRSRRVFDRLLRGGLPLGKVLVMGQVALSVALLIGAGLFVRTLQNLLSVPLGFNSRGMLEFGLDPGARGYKDARAVQYEREILERIAAAPGVTGVALSMNGFFTGSDSGLPVALEGYTAPDGQPSGAAFEEISPGYFQLTGIPLIAGRDLTAQDGGNGPKMAVINQTMADRFFSHRSPLGMQIRDLYPDDHGAVYTIVGVVKDAKHNRLNEKPRPLFYLSFFNGYGSDDHSFGQVLVRTSGSPSDLASVRQAMLSLDPDFPPTAIRAVSRLVDATVDEQRMMATLSGFFGALALLLTVIGLYGVVSYGVARRTSEIGVRMALGAHRRGVIWMILSEALLVVAVGLLLGVPASILAGRAVASQFFGVKAYDPLTLSWAAFTLVAVALRCE